MEAPSTQQIRRAQMGDRNAQEQVLAYLYPYVRKHLSFVIGFRSFIEDEAVQESLLQIYRALPSFRFRASIKTWALRIASRTTRRLLRAHRRQLATFSESGVPPEDVPDGFSVQDDATRDDLIALAAHLAKLGLKKREAFVLIEVLGLTAQEAGAVLGVSPNTAASRHRHARGELRELFAQESEK